MNRQWRGLIIFQILFLIIPMISLLGCNNSLKNISDERTQTVNQLPITIYGTLSTRGNSPFTYTVLTTGDGLTYILTGEPVVSMLQQNKGELYVVTGEKLEADPLFDNSPLVTVTDFLIMD